VDRDWTVDPQVGIYRDAVDGACEFCVRLLEKLDDPGGAEVFPPFPFLMFYSVRVS
jgi:hypothetical protein